MTKKLIKSKERVQKHGEVFTPQWMVKKMLAESGIQAKIHSLHATFLEPSAGEGAFLTEILRQKLAYVNETTPYKFKDMDKINIWKRATLWVLMSIYGIEYLEDNLKTARKAMLDVFCSNYRHITKRSLGKTSELYKSAALIINLNIVQGNTLTKMTLNNLSIVFNEWKSLDENDIKVKRIPFTYASIFPDSNEVTIEEQLGLWNTVETFNLFEKPAPPVMPEYKEVDVLKIYKEELSQKDVTHG